MDKAAVRSAELGRDFVGEHVEQQRATQIAVRRANLGTQLEAAQNRERERATAANEAMLAEGIKRL